MRRLLVLALLALACSTARPREARPPEPADLGERRERWLFAQRAYPFGTIPADGRRKAFAEVERDRAVRANSVESDAATTYWRALGPQPVHTEWSWDAATGRVVSLAIAPNDPNLVLAGAAGGGIWRSTDGGAHFSPVSDGQVDLAVGEIAFAPSNPNVVYAAMGNDFLGSGVLRSDDAGAHWQHVSGPSYGTLGSAPSLVIDRTNANRLWVAQYSRLDPPSGDLFSGGILRSADGGATWSSQFVGLTSDLARLPDGDTLLAGVVRNDEQSGNAGIYRSTNGGATWTLVVNAGNDAYAYPRIGVTPASPQRVYAQMFSNGPSGVRYRFLTSDTGGMTWSDAAAIGLPDEYSLFVAADPVNPLVVYVGMRDLYKSTDGGATFRNMTKGYRSDGNFDPEHSTSHVDQHALAFAPNALYLGNDGGIFRSTDGATTFTSLSGALSLVQAYGVAAHPLDPYAIFLGTQDNGLERRDGDGRWRELITGDYGSIVFDANDPEILASNYVEGLILAFTGRGSFYFDTLATNSTFGESEDGGRISFIAPFESLRSAATLYFGTWRLFTSHDFGRTWSAPGGFTDLTKGDPDTLSAIGTSASNPNAIYTGSMRGQVMTTRNAGVTWTPVMTGLPDRAVRAITVDPTSSDVAYVGFSGYAAKHVWKTTSGGASWQALDQGLPDVPVNALLLDGDLLYAGTDIGVFRWQNGQWTYFSNGMPPVIVTDFATTASGTILAATHGRGAYELVEGTGKRRGVRH